MWDCHPSPARLTRTQGTKSLKINWLSSINRKSQQQQTLLPQKKHKPPPCPKGLRFKAPTGVQVMKVAGIRARRFLRSGQDPQHLPQAARRRRHGACGHDPPLQRGRRRRGSVPHSLALQKGKRRPHSHLALERKNSLVGRSGARAAGSVRPGPHPLPQARMCPASPGPWFPRATLPCGKQRPAVGDGQAWASPRKELQPTAFSPASSPTTPGLHQRGMGHGVPGRVLWAPLTW